MNAFEIFKDWFSATPPEPVEQLLYEPKKNITAWELARVVSLVVHGNQRFRQPSSVIREYRKMPKSVQRHFKVRKV